jgi:uncharacterized protein with FMN-binding domain
MKRITFWMLSTLSVVVLLFGYDGSTSASTSAVTPPAVVSGNGSASTRSAGPGTTPSKRSASTPSGSATPSPTTRTVTGGVAQTQWGPVQVQLMVAGGSITKVSVLQQPSGNPKDTEINNYAIPILTRETTAAQSAGIDMVSGATVTSTGYLQSLQSAIDAAHL